MLASRRRSCFVACESRHFEEGEDDVWTKERMHEISQGQSLLCEEIYYTAIYEEDNKSEKIGALGGE